MEDTIKTISQMIWGLPLILTLVGIGIYFSFRLRFIQIRELKQAFKYTLNSKRKDSTLVGDISNFGALCTALSATLGVGNIVGVAVALSVGGPGSLFWLLISSFFSLSTKYCEGFLAVKYRSIGSDKKIAGGPMYYIEKGFSNKLLAKFLARSFAILGIITALIATGTLPQTNSIAAAASYFGVPVCVTVVILGTVVALVIFGGIKRIADIAEKVVPFMTVLYIGAALIILLLNVDMIIPTFKSICRDAFSMQAATGGGIGCIIHSIQTGVSRGIFCHEAGLGSAAIASAAAKTKSPKEQGLICMVGAFLSIIICFITGLVLIITGTMDPALGLAETSLTAHAFETGLGSSSLGNSIVNLSIIFFAFTTIIGWNYYGEKCAQYVVGTKAITFYRILFMAFVLVGPFLQIKTIFFIADIGIALMALPNVISILLLQREITE